MNQGLAIQKYRAAILSDGGLYRNRGRGNAFFSMSLSDNKNGLVQREQIPIRDLLEFLQLFVVEVLKPLKIGPLSGYPKVESRIGKSKRGKWVPGVRLITQIHELNTELHHKYYIDGKKIIPKDLVLTDVFLAWFFMFDGTSAWNGTGGPGVGVKLCTDGFDLHSVEVLEKQLHKFDIGTGRHCAEVESGAGIEIKILEDSVDHFMGVIDPYVIPPYRYKVKYRGSCPPELAEKYRERNRECQRRFRKRKEKEAIFNSLTRIRDMIRK